MDLVADPHEPGFDNLRRDPEAREVAHPRHFQAVVFGNRPECRSIVGQAPLGQRGHHAARRSRSELPAGFTNGGGPVGLESGGVACRAPSVANADVRRAGRIGPRRTIEQESSDRWTLGTQDLASVEVPQREPAMRRL